MYIHLARGFAAALPEVVFFIAEMALGLPSGSVAHGVYRWRLDKL